MAEQFIESTLMDGYVGGPHITETQTGLANQGLYGPDDYVLSSGRKAEAQVLTNNSIRIFDAVFVIQGRRDVIAANDYTDVSIDNGAQGMNRNDIIVRRYTKDESSEIENTEYAVIKGTPTSGEAEDPAVTIGDIRSGALEHEMKLYRVKLEGLNIVAVESLFQVLMDMSTLNAYLAELQSKYSAIKVTIKRYPMTLEPNDYIGKNIGELQITREDLENYGDIIGVSFGGSSTAVGEAHVTYEGDPDRTWVYASCVDSSGTLRVCFLKVGES